VAAIHGTGGGSAVGMARGEGGAPFMGGQGACKRPQGTTATSMGARAGLGGSEQQGRQARNGPVVLGRAWLRGTSLGKARGGSDVEAVYGAHAQALWRAGAWETSRRPEIVSDWPCSSEIFSKNLNTSARSDEYVSCRSSYPLQLL
jgi:hypothetical protein